ncbi:RIP metalloprotease RseP [Nitrococcus mobilis]|uniref:Zinc metalloprotease n=1 Tax=Nitrococcus mobilis Nb-231 TaxID=314278 RepID=A4BS29_9GAMM|nr:RIP metalloprotease RseP [Nitrococcus mobilis]EAR21508.1 Peptidase M50, putative membrane-associated zinc metallopeptidase [Nitrococcus mobilis Nb-231]
MGILIDVLAFVVAIGVLVIVHEFGHFWVARRMGIKVLRFSVGFGRPIWSRIGRDGTEYAVAGIPLGGYVKMLDEREAEVAEEQRAHAFNRKPIWARNLVVVAGPLFNFLFAILAYWAIFVIGSTELRPVIGKVVEGTPAASAGFQRGDEVRAIADEATPSWTDVLMELLDKGAGSGQLAVQVETEQGVEATRYLDLGEIGPLGKNPDVLGALGFRPWLPRVEPKVSQVLPDSAAAAAGIEPGMTIVRADGQPIDIWQDLVRYVQARPGEQTTFTIEQHGQQRQVVVTLGSRRAENGTRVGVLGVMPVVPQQDIESLHHTVQYGPIEAIGRALNQTWDASALTVKMLWRMVSGEASMKNLSGPINIAQYAGVSASLGVTPFLKFLAIVSISLGVINLLPVPVLDGGHLLYNSIEWVKGRPLSDRAQGIGQQIGIVLLVFLMVFAFYNDLARLFGPQ